ncbi:MAG: MMPL family transporter, partial [Planctomycetales bacterium]|nr:MMPL family transporter [Planctomycetales bacterium]
TRAMTYRSGWSKSLEKSRSELESSDYLRTDKSEQSQGSELWRISLRLGALNDIDYGTFVNDLKETVEPIMSAYQVRSDLLHKLAERHGGSFRGQRIWLVGYPAPPEEDGDEPTDASDDSAELQNEQTELFAHTLFELLRNAGLNVARMGQQARPIQEWQEKLGVADGVVLISDVQQTAAEDLIKLNPLVLDSRAHHFTPGNQTANQRGASVSTVYTGLVPIVYKAQRTLLQSLIESTGWAFVMIAVVMMFLLRSIRAGLISMIPNVFPVICIFGTMGWSGILVDIGSMMTAGVAMGVAVDDTIHFLTWFRRGLDKGLDRIESIKLAYRRVAMSMTQTTAIGGLGLSIFAFSTFTPTQRFGMLMLSLLAAALVGDLIFLPALLASPLGRVFKGSDKKNKLDSTGQRIEGRHAADESVPRPHSLPTGSVRRN